MIKEIDFNKRFFWPLIIFFAISNIGLIVGIISVAISGGEGAMMGIAGFALALILPGYGFVASIYYLRKSLALPEQKSYATILKKERYKFSRGYTHSVSFKLANETTFKIIPIQKKTYDKLCVNASGLLYYKKEPGGNIIFIEFDPQPPTSLQSS